MTTARPGMGAGATSGPLPLDLDHLDLRHTLGHRGNDFAAEFLGSGG